MKKLLLILMPISALIAICCIYLNKDISYIGLLQGIRNMNIFSFDYSGLKEAFETISYTNYFAEAVEWYEYIFAIFQVIGQEFEFIWKVFTFISEYLAFVVFNLFEFLRYVSLYLFS